MCSLAELWCDWLRFKEFWICFCRNTTEMHCGNVFWLFFCFPAAPNTIWRKSVPCIMRMLDYLLACIYFSNTSGWVFLQAKYILTCQCKSSGSSTNTWQLYYFVNSFIILYLRKYQVLQIIQIYIFQRCIYIQVLNIIQITSEANLPGFNFWYIWQVQCFKIKETAHGKSLTYRCWLS